MKKLILAICLILLVAMPASAIVIGFSGPPSDGGGSSFDWTEDFEGSGTPSGWSVDDGSPDFDYTTNPLEGSESFGYFSGGSPLRVNSGSVFSISDGYFGMMFRLDVEPSSKINFMYFKDSSSSSIIALGVDTTSNQFYIRDVASSGEDEISTTYSTGTDYYFKVYYAAGTGSDAVMRLWVSTDGTTWGTPAELTNGQATETLDRLRFECNYENRSYVFDDMRESDTDFDF